MKKVAIIGATGMTGKAVFAEAKAKGFDVTGVVRNETKGHEVLGADAQLLVRDAFELTTEDLVAFDVVVDAFANHQDTYLNLDALTHLIHLLRNQETRLMVVLGAGPLLDESGEYHYEFLKTLPGAEAWVSEPKYGVTELQVLLSTENVNWTAISAQSEFVEGPAGEYKLGKDHLMMAEDGKSHVTSGNLAKALVAEIAEPQFKQERFTVSDI